MYAEYYKLKETPFQLTPDARFYFSSIGHTRAIAHLTYGLAQQEGFIVITGEVGVGKTTLAEHLWSQLDRETYTVGTLMTTRVASNDLLRLVVSCFGIEDPGIDKATLMCRLAAMFRSQRAAGRRCLLVVDEVQNLSFDALEELRMLSNLATDGKSVLQTILLGQPQFRRTLANPNLDQLRQRVLAAYHLGPLSEEETRRYIEHRLTKVGWTGNPHWEDTAFIRMHRETGGIPRKINTLCSRVLLHGAVEESAVITQAVVGMIAEELRQDLGTTALVQSSSICSEASLEALPSRLAELEHRIARQERIMHRLVDLLSALTEPRR